MRYLLDTNIIIYYLDNDKVAVDFITKRFANIAISSITYLEVLVFPYSDKEEKKVRKFLELFTIYDIDREIIELAITSCRNKKVKMADNLIGSTAKLHSLTLVTKNTKDFKNMDIELLDIYD